MPHALKNRNTLILLVALVSVLVYWFYGSQYFLNGLVGDEPYYYGQIARFKAILTHLFSGDFARIAPVWDRIVGNGWFIPALSLFLSPFYYVFREPDHFRVILFLANIGLHLYILYKIARFFGLKAMLIFHFASLAFPLYPLFMGALVGEGLASKLALVLLIRLYEVHRESEPMTVRQAFGIGLLLVLVVYFRQNLIVLCPMVIAIQVLDHLGKSRRWDIGALGSAVAKSAVITLTFLILFLPWSYTLSKKFGGPFLTTTSLHISYIWKYATPDFERERFPEGRHPNQYHAWMNYYTKLAEQSGRSFYTLVDEDKAVLKPQVAPGTVKNYLRHRAKRNFLVPNTFVERFYFGGVGKEGSTGPDQPLAFRVPALLNSYLGFGLLLLGILFLCLIPPPDMDGAFLLLSTKLFILALVFSLLAAGAHHRHLAMLYPLLMFLVAVHAGTGLKIMSLDRSYSSYEKVLIGLQVAIPLILIAQVTWLLT